MKIPYYLKYYYLWSEGKINEFLKTASPEMIAAFEHEIILLGL